MATAGVWYKDIPLKSHEFVSQKGKMNEWGITNLRTMFPGKPWLFLDTEVRRWWRGTKKWAVGLHPKPRAKHKGTTGWVKCRNVTSFMRGTKRHCFIKSMHALYIHCSLLELINFHAGPIKRARIKNRIVLFWLIFGGRVIFAHGHTFLADSGGFTVSCANINRP